MKSSNENPLWRAVDDSRIDDLSAPMLEQTLREARRVRRQRTFARASVTFVILALAVIAVKKPVNPAGPQIEAKAVIPVAKTAPTIKVTALSDDALLAKLSGEQAAIVTVHGHRELVLIDNTPSQDSQSDFEK